MSFGDAVRTCLGKYLGFEGRAHRPEYWWFVLFVFLGSLVLGLVDSILFGPRASPLAGLFQLAMLLPLLAAGWRRLQDTGKPGWYILIPMLIAFGGMILTMSGMLAVGGYMGARGGPDAMTGGAMALGMSGMLLLGILQFVAFILMLWWLTRPGDPGPNEYGPPPAP